MTTGTDIFEAERERLTAAAYRMLGSWAEAEDAVQEAWLRFSQADLSTIREPRAWLTTVVGRICLDVLRSARVRREAYVGPWLPEPLVQRLPADDTAGPDPATLVTEREEISMALLVVLERLTPEQRVAFVLHDVFAVPFAEIAATLGTTPEAARQLASRARHAVENGHQARRSASRDEQRRVVAAFLAAAQSGDLEGLLAVLAPDVVLTGDGGGIVPAGRHPIEGAVPAARFLLGLFRRGQAEGVVDLVPVLVNGQVGVLGEVRAAEGGSMPAFLADLGDVVRFVIAFSVVDGRIVALYDQVNPHKLAAVPPLAELSPQ
jgi:RNA polymerase sigma-70 factor (ECF subfamily)